jgi:heptosyltransferase-2
VTEAPRVLVIQTAFLGDVVLTTPLFRALKSRWRGAFVAALVIPETAAILAGLATVDDVIAYDKRGGGWREFRRVARKVREGKFDVVVSPHRSARSAALARLAGAPRRLGYRESAWPFLYTDRVARPPERHETDRLLALAETLGIEGTDPRPEVALSAREREEARAAAGGKPFAVLSPSSAWPTKRWRPEGFAAVGEYLRGRGLGVVITGTEAEREVCAAVAATLGSAARDLAGRTTPRELAALVAEAAVVVANDSAPVHLASAFDTPTVAVFGATVPAQGFGPLASRSRVAEVEGLTCRPCGAHGGRKCPHKHFRCMLELPPAAVIAAVEAVLERDPAAQRGG